jgi:hypothetical protein
MTFVLAELLADNGTLRRHGHTPVRSLASEFPRRLLISLRAAAESRRSLGSCLAGASTRAVREPRRCYTASQRGSSRRTMNLKRESR